MSVLGPHTLLAPGSPKGMGPAPHTLSFRCPDLGRPLPPGHCPPPSHEATKAGMGTFSEHSQETPLGIFIHLVQKLGAFPQAQDGKDMKPGGYLASHSSKVWAAGMTDFKRDKSGIKTAGGSISKTEQKIGLTSPWCPQGPSFR